MRSKLRESLAHVIIELRPSWDLDGIRQALDHPDVASVNENFAVLAAIRAATDGNVRSPGVIPKPGPHWAEKPANHTPTIAPWKPERLPRTDEELNKATLAAKAAKATLASAKATLWCARCGQSIPRAEWAGHTCEVTA